MFSHWQIAKHITSKTDKKRVNTKIFRWPIRPTSGIYSFEALLPYCLLATPKELVELAAEGEHHFVSVHSVARLFYKQ